MNHIIFNRQRKILQLERASKTFKKSDFLHIESADRILSQFDELIKRRFEKCLNIGSRTGHLTNKIIENKISKQIIETDVSANFLSSKRKGIVADEEFLPFKDESFDLIISNLALHWVNDLPGCLIQIKRILKKGGFFCANLFGGRTLVELRNAILQAESNSASPRISPFIDVRDGASLLQRAKFDEPVSVGEDIIVKYNSLNELLKDLRNTGETNALDKLSNKFVGKSFFNEVEKIYKEKFSDEEENLIATVEIVTISGWKK